MKCGDWYSCISVSHGQTVSSVSTIAQSPCTGALHNSTAVLHNTKSSGRGPAAQHYPYMGWSNRPIWIQSSASTKWCVAIIAHSNRCFARIQVLRVFRHSPQPLCTAGVCHHTCGQRWLEGSCLFCLHPLQWWHSCKLAVAAYLLQPFLFIFECLCVNQCLQEQISCVTYVATVWGLIPYVVGCVSKKCI